MKPRLFAIVAGLVLLALGGAGLVPQLVSVEDDPLRVAAGVGGPQLFGLFPASLPLSILQLLFGLWGCYASGRHRRAILFARTAGLVFLVLLVMGTIPGLDTAFGAAPLYGNNLLVHGTLALLGLLFGWLYRRPRAVAEPAPAPEPARF